MAPFFARRKKEVKPSLLEQMSLDMSVSITTSSVPPTHASSTVAQKPTKSGALDSHAKPVSMPQVLNTNSSPPPYSLRPACFEDLSHSTYKRIIQEQNNSSKTGTPRRDSSSSSSSSESESDSSHKKKKKHKKKGSKKKSSKKAYKAALYHETMGRADSSTYQFKGREGSSSSSDSSSSSSSSSTSDSSYADIMEAKYRRKALKKLGKQLSNVKVEDQVSHSNYASSSKSKGSHKHGGGHKAHKNVENTSLPMHFPQVFDASTSSNSRSIPTMDSAQQSAEQIQIPTVSSALTMPTSPHFSEATSRGSMADLGSEFSNRDNVTFPVSPSHWNEPPQHNGSPAYPAIYPSSPNLPSSPYYDVDRNGYGQTGSGNPYAAHDVSSGYYRPDSGPNSEFPSNDPIVRDTSVPFMMPEPRVGGY